MLALSTTQALTFMDSTVLKNAPSSLSSAKPFSSPPTASVWSQDNATLFVAFQDSVHQYSPSGSHINEIYSTADGITSLIARDNGQAIIFSESNNIHVLEYGSGTGKVTQTFTSHKSPINSLSLSNDSTLLASVSSSAAHVHNLSLGSHTVLRGLPQSSGQITTCAFHLHSRTRILLGQGKQILIYDTTRPSGPVKVIPMNDASSGDIVAVACSPFSKTLVAVATSGGNVGLIDLDKEKGLFRTLNLKVPLTSASFSPEGAALYFGTENGKLLILDLRSLDKAPKCVNVGEGGYRIQCMSFQKKVKVTPDSKAKLAASTSVKPTPQPESATTTTGSTRRPAASKTASRTGIMTGSPARPGTRRGSATAATVATTSEKSAKPKAADKKVFSPVRDPLGNIMGAGVISTRVEPLGSLSKKTAKYENGPLARNNEREKEPRPSSRISITRGTSSRSSSSLGISRTRTRAGSTVSRADSALSARRTDRPASRADSSISSPDLPTPCTISAFSKQTTTSNDQDMDSGMPSPELPPTIVADPVTPVPLGKKMFGMGVLGLGTPEVKKWVEAGKRKEDARSKGNGRRVGFKEMSDKEDEGRDDDDDEDAEAEDTQRNLSMQISPRRVPPAWVQTASHAQTAIPSPLRTLSASPSPSSASAAHNLLRSIIADVMYDYQRETKAEMMGLHLDLVRMGRGLRKELRDVAEGGVGGLVELERLREENRLLKEENERLRRGY